MSRRVFRLFERSKPRHSFFVCRIGHIRCPECRVGLTRWNPRICDAGVTQNLPTLTKLTSLTLHGYWFQITCLFATQPGEFGLQVRLPLILIFRFLLLLSSEMW